MPAAGIIPHDFSIEVLINFVFRNGKLLLHLHFKEWLFRITTISRADGHCRWEVTLSGSDLDELFYECRKKLLRLSIIFFRKTERSAEE